MKTDCPQETQRDAAFALLTVRRSEALSERFSTNNGTILFVWAGIFLLDMMLFDVGRLIHSWLFGPIAMTVINGVTAAWRFWYERTLPIRPRRALTNRVIFWWSWYYVILVLAGVAGWLIIFDTYPPLWFTLLGVMGALPLAVAGYRQRIRTSV